MFAEREERTIQQRVAAAVGDDRFEVALVSEEQNTVADSELRWVEYDAVTNLPDRPLVGWEQLVVFTDRYVYQWDVHDFHHIREQVPRHPEAVRDDQ